MGVDDLPYEKRRAHLEQSYVMVVLYKCQINQFKISADYFQKRKSFCQKEPGLSAATGRGNYYSDTPKALDENDLCEGGTRSWMVHLSKASLVYVADLSVMR